MISQQICIEKYREWRSEDLQSRRSHHWRHTEFSTLLPNNNYNLWVETIFKLRQSSSWGKKIETTKLRQKKNWDKKNWDKKNLLDENALNWDNLWVETKKKFFLKKKIWEKCFKLLYLRVETTSSWNHLQVETKKWDKKILFDKKCFEAIFELRQSSRQKK